jgi:hypothetical protein
VVQAQHTRERDSDHHVSLVEEEAPVKTVKDVLALLGLVLVAWVLLALLEAIPHVTRVLGK